MALIQITAPIRGQLSDGTRFAQHEIIDVSLADANAMVAAGQARDLGKVDVQVAGTSVGVRRAINFVAGADAEINGADDEENDAVDVEIIGTDAV
jgi:hypothetical protein